MAIQVLKCKCGSVFAGCIEPDCYSDSDWHKDMRKNAAKGGTTEIVEHGSFSFGKCTCKKSKPVQTKMELNT